LLAGDTPPAVQVQSISDNGIQLADGLIMTGPCIFLEGKVFLWDVPSLDLSSRTTEERWKDWNEKRFELFEVVTPRPGKNLSVRNRKDSCAAAVCFAGMAQEAWNTTRSHGY